MRIGSKDLGTGTSDVYIIAEIGGNHNGDPDIAHQLIDQAVRTRADAVKFQTYKAETLVHPEMEAVPVARKHFRTQFERFRSLELSDDVYSSLIEHCQECGIDFLTTPYDIDLLDKYARFMPAIKIASGDATYHQLIRAAVQTGKPVITSTGFCTMREVMDIANLIPAEQRALLHCVSIYPLPDNQINLNAITAMTENFPDSVIGYSDHSIGAEACICATALGARIVEKHFTLDRTQIPGDHVLSLEQEQFADMVSAIKRVAQMRGDGIKPSPGEELLRKQFRRGIYAAKNLNKGHIIEESDLLLIRPLSTIGVEQTDNLVNKRLRRDIISRKEISPDDIESDM